MLYHANLTFFNTDLKLHTWLKTWHITKMTCKYKMNDFEPVNQEEKKRNAIVTNIVW